MCIRWNNRSGAHSAEFIPVTLDNDRQEPIDRLLAELLRQLQQATTAEERADVFAWALQQGATIAQIRDVFDAWENRERLQSAAREGTGTCEAHPPRAAAQELKDSSQPAVTPEPARVTETSSSIDDSKDSLEHPRPAGSV